MHIHFVGIGGIGMSGIAEVLLNLGYTVSGSDLKRSSLTTRLKKRGAKIFFSHHEKNIAGADVAVFSSAVSKKHNKEIIGAQKQGIPVIRRAEMLAELMRLTKFGIAVAGTHGKTTTTSLLAILLHVAGLDPTVVIGGKVNSLRSNARLGKGPFMIAEADESDGSFLHLTPTMALVTNIDADHLENFKNHAAYKEAFLKFCQKIPFYGVVALCGEDKSAKELAQKLGKRTLLYGFSSSHDWNAQNLRFVHTTSFFDLYQGKNFIDNIQLSIPGKHNVLNALGAISLATELGIPLSKIKKGLKNFKGVGRRMEVLFKGSEIVVVDDYAHHPTEIRATLTAIKNAFTGRLVVVFQPHRYTRLKNFYRDFCQCFTLANKLFITKVYAAGEKPLKGFHSKKLVSDLEKNFDVTYLPDAKTMLETVLTQIQPGDIVITLGAGDITKTAREMARKLKQRFHS